MPSACESEQMGGQPLPVAFGCPGDEADYRPNQDPDAPDEAHLQAAAHDKLSWAAYLLLSWSSIGVIFGDIATSPLYVYINVFQELETPGPPEKADVLGAVSLIFWTLTLEVLVKYIGVVLRADDLGQGGTFALYSLLCRNMGIKPHGARGAVQHTHVPKAKQVPSVPAVAAGGDGDGGNTGQHASASSERFGSTTAASGDNDRNTLVSQLPHDASDGAQSHAALGSGLSGQSSRRPQRRREWWQRWCANKEGVAKFFRRSRRAQVALWVVSVVATAMLIGDGVLTPAISVLSAVSGLRVAAPSLSQNVVVAATILVLCLVFVLQQLGTGQVGRFFAPIIALWLAANTAINVYNLVRYGGAVFEAINPFYIGTFFSRHGASAWRALGAVMLCVTGAEALFADLGHFSRGSISVAFGVLAYPCLVLTYFGQAAHVIAHPKDTDAFWKSMPPKLVYPMLVLATLATIVASQALISGVFSIVRQAMILGAFPPVRVVHTGGADPAAATQVYVPLANALLFILCCAVVAGFRDTVALGKAYGLAVMTDMMTTTCLVTLVMVAVWEASLLLVVPFFGLFLVVEGAYWSANLIKVPDGGWFTLAVALGVSAIMFIWWSGSRRLGERLAALTAGAQIRLLGAPQPPPLLLRPPTTRLTSTLESSGPQAVGAGMLARLSSWVLQRSSTANNSRGSSWQAPPGVRSRSGIAAASAPLPRQEVGPLRRDLSLSLSRANGGRAATGPHWGATRVPEVVVGEDRGGAGGAAPARALALASHGTVPTGDAVVLSAAIVPWLSGKEASLPSLRRRADRARMEEEFPPGTLALVLPGRAEMSRAPGGGSGGGGGGGDGATRLGTAAVEASDVEAAASDVQGGSPASQPSIILPLAARLAGVGVYYMDEKIGGANAALTSLPPVLVHFMRNVQAVHAVCIFLSVRRLPIPSVPRCQRLHVYAPHSATPPNFYQVVARYGYLDIIDHGPAFISELLDAVLRRLVAAARRAAITGAGRGGGIDGGGGAGPRVLAPAGPKVQTPTLAPEHLTTLKENPSPDRSRGRQSGAAEAADDGDDEDPEDQDRSDRPLARLGQHSASVVLRLEGVRRSWTPAPVASASAPVGASGDAGSSVQSGGGGGGDGQLRAEGRGGGGGGGGAAGFDEAELRSQVEDTVAAFLEAQLHGVVYYASRALIRVPTRADAWPLTQLLHWFVYGLLYRWLAAVSYVDMERWHVPSENLIELGMPVEI